MNSITITGNLGKEAELRSLADGTSVASFSVADSMGRDKPTIWWNCSLFGKRADTLLQYLTKGQQVTIIGTVSEREWTDKDGQKHKSMDVRVQDVALQGGKREPQSHDYQRPEESRQRPAPTKSAGGGFDDFDESIPF